MRRSDLEDLRNDDGRSRGITALSKLIRGRKHTKPGRIPESDIEFEWRVLTGREKQECLARACQRFESLGIPKELRTYTDLEDELTWQVIGAAMRNRSVKGDDADPYPEPLDTMDNVRDALTVDERDILVSEYMDLEEQVDPDPANMPDIFYDEIISALKKSLKDPTGAASSLSNFGSRTLIGFLLTTASQLLPALTGRSESSPTDGIPSTIDQNPNSPAERK
jgi:hypothetical protein